MEKTAAEVGRGRGKRAGLDLRRILDVARSLDAESLTMQAVADVLGVDRKALNHHVKDRQTLLEIVALDAFVGGFASADVAGAASWQDACREYATGITGGVLAAGRLVGYLWFGDSSTVWALEPTEALFAQLASAGFEDETSVRLVTVLSTLCLSHARDVIQATEAANRPRPDALKAALDTVHKPGFKNLVRISSLGVDTYGPGQLDFAIDIFLTGATAALDAEKVQGRDD